MWKTMRLMAQKEFRPAVIAQEDPLNPKKRTKERLALKGTTPGRPLGPEAQGILTLEDIEEGRGLVLAPGVTAEDQDLAPAPGDIEEGQDLDPEIDIGQVNIPLREDLVEIIIGPAHVTQGPLKIIENVLHLQ